LEWAQTILRKGGVSAQEIDFAVSDPKDSSDAVEAVLKVHALSAATQLW